MTKSEAIALFGGTPSDMARALGITPQAVYQWPNELDQERTDRVIGAAVRLGKLPIDSSTVTDAA
ncbi:MAG: Cro/CI family transcriptional regulator [Gammaproteobacteria bacterium]